MDTSKDPAKLRTPNFSEQEISLLVSLLKKYQNILESKRSDAVTWRQKEDTWQKLAEDFNKETKLKEKRSAKALKGKWENLKKNTKKKFAAEKEELYKTGGGIGDLPKISSQDENIKEIIGVAVTGLNNNFDSDFIEIVYEDEGNEEISREKSYLEANSESLDINQDSSSIRYTPLKLNTLTPSPAICPRKYQSEKKSDDISSKCMENWSTWTPMKLKTPTTKVLQNSREPKPCTKTKLTEDCRQRIKAVSEAKLELILLQKKCLEDDQKRSAEEIALKMAHMKEIHFYEIEKRKLELQILQKNLSNS